MDLPMTSVFQNPVKSSILQFQLVTVPLGLTVKIGVWLCSSASMLLTTTVGAIFRGGSGGGGGAEDDDLLVLLLLKVEESLVFFPASLGSLEGLVVGRVDTTSSRLSAVPPPS